MVERGGSGGRDGFLKYKQMAEESEQDSVDVLVALMTPLH